MINEKDKIHRDILGPAPAKKVEVGARMDQGSYEDDIYSIKREMELVFLYIVSTFFCLVLLQLESDDEEGDGKKKKIKLDSAAVGVKSTPAKKNTGPNRAERRAAMRK